MTTSIELDNLAEKREERQIEAEKLAENIRNVDGKCVVYERMDGCAHGWDKEAVRGTPQCDAKDKAYKMAADMLRKRESGVEKAQTAV